MSQYNTILGTKFNNITSLISLPMDMGGVILNFIPRSKNLCSTRDQVEKLFVAILVNCGFVWGSNKKVVAW
jgi:NADH:ubiquinone oxidoreductase subunit K